MAGQVTRAAAAALVAAVLAAGASGCSDDDNGAASDAASKAASAASSLASRGSDAVASATAKAGEALDSIKGGIDAKDEVELGKPGTDDGRTTVTVTARNTSDDTQSFAVQVEFRDEDGKLVDVVVVTVSDVAANSSGTGTARSTHELSGSVKAEVGTALRY
ncbi:FxLYD domain-containing protein [Streptomyces sp. P17]|uniref:FxLYD domain-containing protein n=1 Tax=Streptomyces sp. P17 TaxID=3074716 RepID=UPI0028F40B02|nr:FxLYD domain-containing protein [Streptomyces sp. P17]MDT9699381.1 FxLYD domain-containing protein [Streptomyces sp. P17]